MSGSDIAAMLGGMNPDAIARKLLLGDFGESLCKFLNRHQKGNRLIMETLTQRPYPLKAVHPAQLYESIKGPEGNKGLLFILELMEAQQHDIVAALQAAVQRGKQAAAAEVKATVAPAIAERVQGPPSGGGNTHPNRPEPAQAEADRDAQADPQASIHGPPAQKVEVAAAASEEEAEAQAEAADADDSEE